MQFVSKKAILSILYQLHVTHDCDKVKKKALAEVAKKWDEYFEVLTEESKRLPESPRTSHGNELSFIQEGGDLSSRSVNSLLEGGDEVDPV